MLTGNWGTEWKEIVVLGGRTVESLIGAIDASLREDFVLGIDSQ